MASLTRYSAADSDFADFDFEKTWPFGPACLKLFARFGIHVEGSPFEPNPVAETSSEGYSPPAKASRGAAVKPDPKLVSPRVDEESQIQRASKQAPSTAAEGRKRHREDDANVVTCGAKRLKGETSPRPSRIPVATGSAPSNAGRQEGAASQPVSRGVLTLTAPYSPPERERSMSISTIASAAALPRKRSPSRERFGAACEDIASTEHRGSTPKLRSLSMDLRGGIPVAQSSMLRSSLTMGARSLPPAPSFRMAPFPLTSPSSAPQLLPATSQPMFPASSAFAEVALGTGKPRSIAPLPLAVPARSPPPAGTPPLAQTVAPKGSNTGFLYSSLANANTRCIAANRRDYAPLIRVMRELEGQGQFSPIPATIGGLLLGSEKVEMRAKFGKVTTYIRSAEAAGVVSTAFESAGNHWHEFSVFLHADYA